MNQKIRVGIIGVSLRSWAARSHIPALQLIPEFDVTAISTTQLASARAAAEQFGIAYAFDNEQELVNCPVVDLVVIAVKVPFHSQLVKAAIAAGKMIYCEWPLSKDTPEAEELASLTQAKGVRTFVGLQALTRPETISLKQVLSSSLIGSGGGWAVARDEASRYMLDPANGVTMLTIPFGHTLAAYTAVLGNYQTLSATVARRRTEVPLLTTGKLVLQRTDDQLVVTGLLAEGLVSSIHYRSGVSAATNFLWEINGTEGDLLITGELGHYQLTPVKLQYAPSGGPVQPLDIPPGLLLTEVAVPAQPIYGLYYAYRTVLNDLHQKIRLMPDFTAGLRLHRLLDRIQQSASEQKTIDLLI